eukprot:TRINITY_DN985_c0_g1_i2.p1 TRINITY_DN985_c0_g1~~TRINITY_DN985_c0_g1_i2.p1  ORF type:complete len:159 (-),score=48.03 TRINITY_DN985_c0_g1_i2:28-504(-)
MFGAVGVGVISDKIFKAKRNPVYVLCSVLVVGAFIALLWMPNAVSAAIVLFFACFWLFGSFSLVAFSAVLDVGDSSSSSGKGVAFFAGIMGLFQYLGSGLSGIVSAAVIEKYGYHGWLISNAIACAIAALPAVLLDKDIYSWFFSRLPSCSNSRNPTL